MQNVIGSKISSIMPTIKNILGRDLVCIHRGDSMPVKLSDNLIRRGWRGGEFSRWVDGGTLDPTVDIADGRYCGFFLYGSKERSFQYTVQEESNVTYGNTVIGSGGNFVYIIMYERYGYNARHGLGPVVPLVYKPNANLFISENGLVTTENESDFSIFPVHTFPDGDPITTLFIQFGLCVVPPSAVTNDYLCMQTNVGV